MKHVPIPHAGFHAWLGSANWPAEFGFRHWVQSVPGGGVAERPADFDFRPGPRSNSGENGSAERPA